MYWKIGHRIYIYFINNHRAEYGKQFVSQAATKLSWSHFIELLSLKEEIKRDFYLTMTLNETWGRDALRGKIDGMLFERTLISGIPDELIKTELANMRNGVSMSPD